MKMKLRLGSLLIIFVCGLVLPVPGCTRNTDKVAAERYLGPDKLYQTVEENVRSHSKYELIVDIDHSRLAAKAGSSMPPAHVIIWSDPELDAAILKHNPLASIDLPLRVLAFEVNETGKAAVITNSYDYLANRHSLPDDPDIRTRYEAAIAQAMTGIPKDAIALFASDVMTDSGLVTLTSMHDFATTERRILDAINAQSDTVSFGKIDFTDRSKEHGIDLEPIILILFGGPGPGGKAMASAPTLGLDAFCQKLVIWQDGSGTVHVTFNDLLALAERQQVSVGIPLSVINRRLRETVSAAVEE